MALTVAELRVQIDAETRELRNQLRVAESRISSFERGVEASTDRAKQSFAGIGTAVVAVGAALAALGIGRGLVSLVRTSIDAAASFESFRVRLQNFLGTQEEATAAVADFTELAARTPFAVGEVVEAGAVLGSVALGNRDALRELTFQATNLAAVTGLDLPAAASNLQRALVGGITAADLFRERGVKRLLESVLQIPDATKLSTEQLGKAFQDLVGTGGVFQRAGEDLSLTLTGALSNIGDAAERLQAELGDTFRPAILAGARQFLIPLLDRIRELITENSEALLKFAQKSVIAAAQAFGTLAQSLAFVLRALVVFQRLIRTARANVANFIADVTTGLSLLGIVGTDAVKIAQDVAVGFEREAGEELLLDQLADGAAKLADEITKAGAALEGFDFDQFNRQTEEQLRTQEKLKALFEATAGVGLTDPKTLKAAEADLKKIESFVTRITDAQTRTVEPLRQQTDVLDRQLVKARALLAISETRESAEKVISALLTERQRLTDKLTDATLRQAEAQGNISQLLGRLEIFDDEAAEDLAEDFARAFESARGAEARAKVAEDFQRKIQDALDKVVIDPATAPETLAGGIGDAIRLALDPTVENFSARLGDALAARAEEGLAQGFDEALKLLENGLEKAFASAGSFLGEVLGGAAEEGASGFLSGFGKLAGPLASIATGVIGAALRDDEIESAAAGITSAVTSAQQVRGIVAGPTEIAVAQVDRAISEAFVETNRLLSLIRGDTVTIARNSAPSGGGSLTAGGDEATEALANESASLI